VGYVARVHTLTELLGGKFNISDDTNNDDEALHPLVKDEIVQLESVQVNNSADQISIQGVDIVSPTGILIVQGLRLSITTPISLPTARCKYEY
jgi:hypothetical protein